MIYTTNSRVLVCLLGGFGGVVERRWLGDKRRGLRLVVGDAAASFFTLGQLVRDLRLLLHRTLFALSSPRLSLQSGIAITEVPEDVKAACKKLRFRKVPPRSTCPRIHRIASSCCTVPVGGATGVVDLATASSRPR